MKRITEEQKGLRVLIAAALNRGKRVKRKPNPSHILFEKHLIELGIRFQREVKVCEGRRWRWDFVLWYTFGEKGKVIAPGTAVEIMGGIYVRGGHNRGKQYQSDCDKANEGVAQGLRVLRFTTDDILSGRAKTFIAERII